MTPRSAESNQQMREESRAWILEHALQLFAEHGYDRTTVRMIAERAGISQGLLYNYFDGKAAVLRAIYERSIGDVRASFGRAEAGVPGRRVEGLVRGAFEILRQNQAFWRLSYGARMQAAVLADLGPELQDWTAEIQGTLERYLREDGAEQPELDAAILFAVIDGVAQHYVLDPRGYPLDEVIERLIARFAGRVR